ncbi:hypothetical protein PCANC_03835 [Puccinia coronata f. sp. avenae]|uniref:Uncharacterized protein n=1 Tax=Puccinia coronata f. sp. avenae TaxID=200324 RepID=A0A2N5T7A2_9BASI|nr:hypothetical protein PCANC_03835 [Puccinia coronata f. sp. avenae]
MLGSKNKPQLVVLHPPPGPLPCSMGSAESGNEIVNANQHQRSVGEHEVILQDSSNTVISKRPSLAQDPVGPICSGHGPSWHTTINRDGERRWAEVCKGIPRSSARFDWINSYRIIEKSFLPLWLQLARPLGIPNLYAQTTLASLTASNSRFTLFLPHQSPIAPSIKVNMSEEAQREGRITHSRHAHGQAHKHSSSQYPTTTTQSESISSESLLQTRDVFRHATPVKIDSNAGATGTSVAQLPGRHFIVPPWLALVVWSFILIFIGLTIAGFILSYQARKEFRMRVEEQRKAQSEAEQGASECKVPMTRKEFKSFTRKSIMILNTNSARVRNLPNPTYDIDNSGGLRPRNVFDRPPRESILVAEIAPCGSFTGDDSFAEFSRQMRREGLWDLAARKSKAISAASLSSIVPRMGARRSNRFTMMETAAEELSEQSFHYHPPKDILSRPSNSRALRHIEATHGPDVRLEDHSVQPSRFIPPVPKLPTEFAMETLNPSESLSSFNDLTFVTLFDGKDLLVIDDDATLSHKMLERSTSRGAEASAKLGTHSGKELTSLQRNTSLRSHADGWSEPSDETSDTQATMAAHVNRSTPDDAAAIYTSARAAAPSPFPENDVSPDDAVAQYASSRAGTPFGMPQSEMSPDTAVANYALARACAPSPFQKNDISFDDAFARRDSSRAGTPFGMPQSEMSPDTAVANYALARASAPSPFQKNDFSLDDAFARRDSSRAGTPFGIPQSEMSPDTAVANYALARASAPSPFQKNDVSHDDVLAHYASSRAGTPSPMPQGYACPDSAVSANSSSRSGAVSPFTGRWSGSVMGFLRRTSSNGNLASASQEAQHQLAPSAQNICDLESLTEPLPITHRDGDAQPSLRNHNPSENGDQFCKPFSVIFEEDDEDYSHMPAANQIPFTPTKPRGWNSPQASLFDTEKVALPRRLPQASISRTPSHGNRLRSHTVNSQWSESTGTKRTSDTSRATSSSQDTRSRSGSYGTRPSENSFQHPPKQPASSPPLTLKRNPSLSTNPYGRRKKQLDLNQHLPLSPRHHLDRHFSDQQKRPLKRHPSNPRSPRGPSQGQEILDSDGTSTMRRTASAQARLPLSGTMSSGGVRNSSFVP